MLKVNVHFFGVPGQFETYPADGLNSYLQQFYDSSAVPWRFLIRQAKNNVRYIYINYGLISGADRTGSLFGICVELEGYYFTTPRTQILVALREISKKLVADGDVLSLINGNEIKFTIKKFQERKDYLDQLQNTVEKGFESQFREDVARLTTNLETLSPENVAQITEDEKSDSVVVNHFLQYGGVNIIPAPAATQTVEKKPEIVSPSKQESDYWKERALEKEQEIKEERGKRVEAEEKEVKEKEKRIEAEKKQAKAERELHEWKNNTVNVTEKHVPIRPSGSRNDKADMPSWNSGGDKNPGFSIGPSFVISIIIAILILFFVLRGIFGLFGGGNNNTTIDSSSPTDTTSKVVVFNTPKDTTSPTTHRTGHSEHFDTANSHTTADKTHPASDKSQQISNLRAQVNFYIDTEPYNENKDKGFLSSAGKLNCKDQVQDLLDNHRDDSKLYTSMKKEIDISKLNTLSYKIAVLLQKGQSEDEIIASLPKATHKIIGSVEQNLSSFK